MPKAAARKTRESTPQPVPVDVPLFELRIDWNSMPLLEAQQWYAKLKAEFENAGRILNARASNKLSEGYECFMAGKSVNGTKACAKGITHSGIPRGVDYSYRDPETGLLCVARICSERCWILYNQFRIDQRRERYIAEAEANR